jgi:hypothetical protein
MLQVGHGRDGEREMVETDLGFVERASRRRLK